MKDKWSLSFAINVKQLLNKQYSKIHLSQKHYWENFEITYSKYRFWILKIIVFLADIGYLVKLLSNHYATLSPLNFENISNFEGRSLTLTAYEKRVVYKL